MPLIKFLIITLIVLWVIRTLVRLVFPMVLRNVFGAAQNQSQQSYQQHQHQNPKKEGAISIDFIPKKEKKGNADKLGDFVDYEEVK